MADTATTYGVSHAFGLNGTLAFATIQTDDISIKKALDVEVMDEFGKVITDRLDDSRAEVSVSGVLKAKSTYPEIGMHYTYDSIQYIIKEITDAGTNNGYRKVS
jgi:bifunctional DNA-binding transcriptional regulator/antitoxin component of YhaV-PrlF toxin-antitoxin module